MDKEILERLDKIEKQMIKKKKDMWEKLQVIAPLLIPISIALVGWYFTNEHNKNQLQIQKSNNENQFHVAVINSNVGQSELIKDLMQHLTSKDTSVRNIAIEAILYAAPAPGKKIIEIIARTSDSSSRTAATDALAGNRVDLVRNLFSPQKQNRIIAASEISSNWDTDPQLVKELIKKAEDSVAGSDATADCENGLYNAMVVLASFAKEVKLLYREKIKALVNKISADKQLTKNLGDELLKSMN